MNIFKWITDRAGKVALSAMQAVGLTAVVGVAGIAAWQYLDSPAETNNMFAPAAYDSGEVVYVAGANTGAYAGGSYAGGGESQSSMQISANTLKRLERQEMSQRAAEEMAEYAPEQSVSAAAAPSQAYQMGGTEGLGTGANAANEFDLKSNPMAAMQQQMAGMSNMISQAQAQAQQQAQAAAPGKAEGSVLASAAKSWSSSGATGGSSGNAFNSSFAVQDSGKNNKGPSVTGNIPNPQEMLASAQSQVKGVMEGASMRARASFGSENIGGNHDASVRGFRSSKEGKDLEFISKRSNDASKNKNRAANEGSRAFLASTKISGGMMISSENVTTGQGQGSKDFESDTQAQLLGIRTWQTDAVEPFDAQRKKDRDDLRKWVWIAVPLALALIPLIARAAFLGSVCGWPWGAIFWAIAGVFAAIAIAPAITLLAKAVSYAQNYKGSSLSTWAGVIGSILTVTIGVSLIPAVGKLLAGYTNWILMLGGAGAGVLSSWMTTGLTKDSAMDTEQLLNTEIESEQGGTTGGNK